MHRIKCIEYYSVHSKDMMQGVLCKENDVWNSLHIIECIVFNIL